MTRAGPGGDAPPPSKSKVAQTINGGDPGDERRAAVDAALDLLVRCAAEAKCPAKTDEWRIRILELVENLSLGDAIARSPADHINFPRSERRRELVNAAKRLRRAENLGLAAFYRPICLSPRALDDLSMALDDPDMEVVNEDFLVWWPDGPGAMANMIERAIARLDFHGSPSPAVRRPFYGAVRGGPHKDAAMREAIAGCWTLLEEVGIEPSTAVNRPLEQLALRVAEAAGRDGKDPDLGRQLRAVASAMRGDPDRE